MELLNLKCTTFETVKEGKEIWGRPDPHTSIAVATSIIEQE